MDTSFFNEQRDQSRIKSEIVAKYFGAWSNIMLRNLKRIGGNRLIYADLFCGPGRYADGSISTPLEVARRAVANPDLAKVLVMIFNDKDRDHVQSLSTELNSLPGIERLANPPQYFESEVSADLSDRMRGYGGAPKFSFIDPWGYKGLSQGVIRSAIRDWGSDCVFFFNYGRINAAINNDIVRIHLDALFGHDRLEAMRAQLEAVPPRVRENMVLEEMARALKDIGGKYVLPFRFRRLDSDRVSHALVFVSKHPLGYGIMKEVMAAASSTTDQGVPSLEYAPADEKCPQLFSYSRPLEGLADELITRFAGRYMTLKSIYDEHNVGTPFIMKNYREAVLALEAAGRLTVADGKRRRPGTLAPALSIQFPAI